MPKPHHDTNVKPSRTSHPSLQLTALPTAEPWMLGHARAMALYLMEFAWSHFVTLTTKWGMHEDRLVREFRDRFVRRLAVVAQHPVPYFYAIEHDYATGRRPHLHAIIGGTAELSITEIRATWRYGLTSVSVYNHREAGAHYITKGLLIDENNYDISRRLPPRRHDRDEQSDLEFLRQLHGGDNEQ